MPFNPNLKRLECQVTPYEWKTLKKQADKNNMSIAQYTRFAVMWCLIEDGNKDIMKSEFNRVKDRIGIQLREKLFKRKEKMA